MSKPLIIYYSRNGENYSNGEIINLPIGNAERITNYIQEKTGADTFKVETIQEYPKDYMKTTEIAEEELKNNARPELKKYLDNINEYDEIYICSPNWWETLPMAMFSQLEKLDFEQKTVKTVITHEGSEIGRVMRDIHKLCEGADIKKAIAIHGSNIDSEITKVDCLINE
ncbi:flavodoxin [Methanosphaera sp. WGK6]|uniref:flavodoxin n=1 Tax=Methanosphaera sp. WGK6 TaxID=1561964 RepID=UPI00084C3BC4|nr:flavodoxin [Methanosphaera sp. WGK6]OED29737.1 flavodoxin [Methanosphaera sp. WGK6]